MVGATGVALLVAWLAGGAGVAAGLLLVAAFVLYQDRRYQALLPATPPPAPAGDGGAAQA